MEVDEKAIWIARRLLGFIALRELLLKHLSKPRYWHGIERDLHARSIAVYALSQDVIRCDATTVSGEHEVTEEGLLQFGHSKDDRHWFRLMSDPHERFCWTTRLCRVMLLRRGISLS